MPEPTPPIITPNWATTGIKTQPPGPYISAGWTASTKPPASYFNWWMDVVAQWTSYFTAKLGILPGANANQVLTITANVITPTQGNVTFQNAGGTVNNAVTTAFDVGCFLTLVGNSLNPTIITGSAGGAGQFILANGGTITLTTKRDSATFQLDNAGNWQEISRSVAVSVTGVVLSTFVATGPYTPVRTSIKVRLWGAGGGGGSGGGSGPGFGVSPSTVGGDTFTSVDITKKARGGNRGLDGVQAYYSGGFTPNGASALVPIIGANSIQAGTFAEQAGQAGSSNGFTSGGLGGGSYQQPELFGISPRTQGNFGAPGGPNNGGTGGFGVVNTGTGAGGGGGGGGSSGTGGGGGGGGGNGEYAEWLLAVTPGVPITVTIGAGGVGGGGSPGDGTTGGGGAGGNGGSGFAIIEE